MGIPPDRFARELYFHPDQAVKGKAYTFAAGVIDGVYDFDPGFFGVSPREACQMDPQQRLLLQVVWEALEHAGTPPSSLRGANVGVYIGASSFDYSTQFVCDNAAADNFMMTGNALSIIANRVSYTLDLQGPSLTIDTACSSAVVALHQACEALRIGAIDTAIVGGINCLLSPTPFVGFSHATMLSPTGLCRAFDARADGYVRAEGAVVLVLRRSAVAAEAGDAVHAEIIGTGINFDGHTDGLSFPSARSQARLLKETYARFGVPPHALAFVEAHGTGTPVGDPAEAEGLARALTQGRAEPLLIGSVKTNIGHLEPASGLAGTLKATLALKKRLLPASLHFETPNPKIPFEDYRLKVAADATALDGHEGPLYAGVNSFGFGGANAHVILREAAPPPRASAAPGRPLIVSAQSREALTAVAALYRDKLSRAVCDDGAVIVNAAAHRRDRLTYRLIAFGADSGAIAGELTNWLDGQRVSAAVDGIRQPGRSDVVFVFSGNGSQWPGMGRAAYMADPDFRAALDRIDRVFARLVGWSVRDALWLDDLAEQLRRAEVAQPLLFAVQASLIEAMAAKGLRPGAVIGHSVGEIAAAYATGAIELRHAALVIRERTAAQAMTRHRGGMAAITTGGSDIDELLAVPEFKQLEIAAINSPVSVTVAGPSEPLDTLLRKLSAAGTVCRRLDLDYPFHCALIEPMREQLIERLSEVDPNPAKIPFLSTVAGTRVEGAHLGGAYWWDNVRRPVLFGAAVRAAAELGFSIFLEIGPRPVLRGYVVETLKQGGFSGVALGSLAPVDTESPDLIARIAATAMANGARIDDAPLFGAPLAASAEDLPLYPWQNKPYRFEPTSESLSPPIGKPHPLLGASQRDGVSDFFNHIDARLLPWLADHRVEDAVVVPGAALVEMALAAAARRFGDHRLELRDFDLVRPLVLEPGVARETLVRSSLDGDMIEILSRPRFEKDQWTLHARGSAGRSSPAPDRAGNTSLAVETITGSQLYDLLEGSRLRYGTSFRLVESVDVVDRTCAVARFAPPVIAFDPELFVLDPALLDAGFHGLAALAARGSTGAVPCFIPTRMEVIAVLEPGRMVRSCRITLERCGKLSAIASFVYCDDGNAPVVRLSGVHFNAIGSGADEKRQLPIYRTVARAGLRRGQDSAAASVFPQGVIPEAERLGLVRPTSPEPGEARLMLEAAAQAVAETALRKVAGETSQRFSIQELIGTGRLSAKRRPLFMCIARYLNFAGAAQNIGGRWVLPDSPKSHPADLLLRTMAADHPEWIAETGALAQIAKELPSFLASSAPRRVISDALEAHLATAGPTIRSMAQTALRLIRETSAAWPRHRALRLLVIGSQNPEFIRDAAESLDSAFASLAVTDVNEDTVAQLASPSTAKHVFEFVPWSALARWDGAFDLAIAVDDAHRWPNLPATLHAIRRTLARNGYLLLFEPKHTLFFDLLRGLDDAWWISAATGSGPLRNLPGPAGWKQVVLGAGFQNAACANLSDPIANGFVVTACATARLARDTFRPPRRLVTVEDTTGDGARLASAIVSLAASEGWTTSRIMAAPAADGDGTSPESGSVANDAQLEARLVRELSGPAGADVLFVLGVAADERDPCAGVLARTSPLAASARALAGKKARLWIVAPGAMRALAGDTEHRPVQAAVWGFARTLGNERPDLNLRLLDTPPAGAPDEAARLVVDEISNPDEEREVVLGGDRRSVLRVIGASVPEPPLGGGAVTTRLAIAQRGDLDRLAWRNAPRRAPEPNEIEIEVAAIGLNFRDVMCALGALPPEAFESGFAGDNLGLECAGIVTQVGTGVGHVAVGDRCIAFAPLAFSRHVTTPAHVVAALPAGISLDAGATLPVAFLTAYYSLVTLGHVVAGETVLIHSAAGGVGLAALQIAKSRGAIVLATAGSAEKRALLAIFGADHVFDSRSLSFADRVMEATSGKGVDVVLNSLAGEAIARSLSCLKPFGRFLELGKRDFYANSRIGTRPFHRNLSYFGIEIDQLLTARRPLAERVFRDLLDEFASERLAPLPYRRFAGGDVASAFRLMQRSTHVGKIVVSPPAPSPAPARQAFVVSEDATYLVTGGLGGFGLALARRLITRGARRLVLVGRRAPADEHARAAIRRAEAEYRAQIEVVGADVAHREEVEKLLRDIASAGRPLRGVFHAAMVMDDALVADLTPRRIAAVLAPKIAGAALLDELTRALPLDCFVLFSSAAALVGSPGQASYAAANTYLEALARQRRSVGLPALAVAWGPIGDVGYLARKKDVASSLQRRFGAHPIPVEQALDCLERLLASDRQDVEAATPCVGGFAWSEAARVLPIVASPFFSLAGSDRRASEPSGDQTALDGIIALGDTPEATEAVSRILVDEIARILRMSNAEVDADRPISHYGVDSLMATELSMFVEERFNIGISQMSLSNDKTVRQLARSVVRRVHEGGEARRSSAMAGSPTAETNGGSLPGVAPGDTDAWAGKVGKAPAK